MAEAGILAEDERVELLDGLVMIMPRRIWPCGRRIPIQSAFPCGHGAARRAIVSVRNPVTPSEYSEVNPDVALLSYHENFYRDKHPQPPDVNLILEVIDDQRPSVREARLPLFAASEVSEVWLVDLVKDGIEVYRRPSEASYSDRHVGKRGDSLSPAAFPDLIIAVNDILG